MPNIGDLGSWKHLRYVQEVAATGASGGGFRGQGSLQCPFLVTSQRSGHGGPEVRDGRRKQSTKEKPEEALPVSGGNETILFLPT